MTRSWLLMLPIFLASCATSDKGLLKADASSYRDPRNILEKSVDREMPPKFFYFDRARKLVFSLGKPIAGFNFAKVDMDWLRSESPEIFSIVQCASGKPCSASAFNSCKAIIPLAAPITDVLQNKIVTTLKSRGYPVVRVDFLKSGDDSGEMEVQYFTECDFIRGDISENFPGLIAVGMAR